MEKLTRVAGQRIRNYDLSRRRDYLLSLVDFGKSPRRSLSLRLRQPPSRIPMRTGSRIGVFLVNLSRKPIMFEALGDIGVHLASNTLIS